MKILAYGNDYKRELSQKNKKDVRTATTEPEGAIPQGTAEPEAKQEEPTAQPAEPEGTAEEEAPKKARRKKKAV